MTEKEIKELAIEYIDSCTKKAGFVILAENIKNDFINLFVAGFMKCLELNKEIKWHDLRKDPNDLPKTDRDVLVKRESEENCQLDNYYNDEIGKGWGRMLRECYATDDVIAWCEIPKYTEE